MLKKKKKKKGIFSLLLGGLIGNSMIKYDIYNNLQGPKMYLCA